MIRAYQHFARRFRAFGATERYSDADRHAAVFRVVAMGSALYPQGVSAGVSLDMVDYQPGDPVLVTAFLIDPADAVLVGSNASAESTFGLPDGTTMSLSLFDDGAHDDGAVGDGVFGNTFTNTVEGGRYAVSVELTADLTGATHRRTAVAPFNVIPDGASFVGSVAESLVDEDSNGLAEAIELAFTIDAEIPGDYAVQLEVADSGGTTLDFMSSGFEVTIVPSQVAVTITIDNLMVFHAGGGDPLTLQSITLVDLTEALIMDTLPDSVTQPYDLIEFEVPDAPVLADILPGDAYEGGGREVVLYGENLDYATDVFVDGSPATQFQVVSDASIAFTVPAGSCGPATVQVTTPWSETTQEGIFVYICDAPPVIVNQPTVDPDCESSSVSLIVVVTGSTPLNYQWRKDGFNILDATDFMLVIEEFTAADQGSYDVVVTNSLGTVTSTGVEVPDCNSTNQPDECDIADGTSQDVDGDGVPDECAVLAPEPPLGADELGVPGASPWPPTAGATTCMTDVECPQEAVCIQDASGGFPGTCYVPKNRYLTVAPNPANDAATARRLSVELTQRLCDGTGPTCTKNNECTGTCDDLPISCAGDAECDAVALGAVCASTGTCVQVLGWFSAPYASGYVRVVDEASRHYEIWKDGQYPIDCGVDALCPANAYCDTGLGGSITCRWNTDDTEVKWTFVFLGDCHISPQIRDVVSPAQGGLGENKAERYYLIESILETASISDSSVYSPALVLPTTRVWGDLTGGVSGGIARPPDGLSGFEDILHQVFRFKDQGRAHLSWLDIHAQEPNQLVGFQDMLDTVNAFKDRPYPYNDPFTCAGPT